LCQQLLGGSYECMVCCDKLRGHREVWSCPCCYHIFHLNCISRWSKSPAAAANEEHPEDGWRCPACQATSTVIPSVYKCFCGKVTNPNKSRKRNDLTVPHTCGEPCRKRLAPSDDSFCPHKCPQLCHPGPCPPCPIVVTRKCPCGKSSSRVRCSQMNLLPSCGQKCLKTLNCGVHKCNDVCHEGPCDSCTVSVPIKCHCQREVKQVLCDMSNEEYSCGKLCNKPLGCGNHTCESDCHPGPCSPCQLLPSTVTHCPCGATPISKLLPLGVNRTSCLDDVPLCDNICSKPLPCSAYSDNVENHTCNSRCHLGACPPCTLTTVIYCGCGQSSEKVSCSKVREREGFTCNRKCGKKLNCGRHQCQTKCCTSESHHCERICGRKHDCGKHTCKEPCHSWRCGPCWNISYDELTCHCGGEVMLPPIPCGTTPPPCTRLCARTHPCDHPVTHPCHSDDFPCPPCTFLTDKMCMGGHLVSPSSWLRVAMVTAHR
jgi:transcriptional repressor NF-X1